MTSSEYAELLEKGRRYLQERLFNGEYFCQEVVWQGLRAGAPDVADVPGSDNYCSPESARLLEEEGPKYQYGQGCLADGVLGAWMAWTCGLDGILDEEKLKAHLLSVHRYNFKKDLREHANPQRPGFAFAGDGGLLLCTWPHGAQPSLPFVYSNEVWTGIEYQVASHMMAMGFVDQALEIVRTCRDRYDGRVRNPFDEYECGHWYARALSSYAMIQGLTGVRYDAVERALYIESPFRSDFRSFLAVAGGYGTVEARDGKVSVDVISGRIDVDRIEYKPRRDPQ